MPKTHNKAKGTIDDILEKVGNRQCIYRGTPKQYSLEPNGVSSTLYRWAKKQAKKKKITWNYPSFEMEREIVIAARKHFRFHSSNLKIVTSLRHFGGNTNVIDFSTSLYVALFFACTGEQTRDDGELILIDKNNLSPKSKIDYKKLSLEPDHPILLIPHRNKVSRARVVSQKSIFVYSKKGFLDEGEYESHRIPKEAKRALLTYLKESHKIDQDSIYADLLGFIQNNENYETAAFYFHSGNAHYASKKYKHAINSYTKAIQINPQFAVTYNNRGLAKNKLGKQQEAAEDYDKAIQTDPLHADAYINRGNVRSELGKYQDAIGDYTMAMRIDPRNALAYNNRGNVKKALSQHQDAIKDYSKAIRINSQHVLAYYNRGNAKWALDKYQDAIGDYNKAIRYNPHYALAYNNRGSVKGKLGRHQDAIEDYTQAIRADPQCADAYIKRGIANSALGEYQKAIKDYGKAIRIKHKFALAYYNRGLAKIQVNDKKGAQRDFAKARKLNPDLPILRENRLRSRVTTV